MVSEQAHSQGRAMSTGVSTSRRLTPDLLARVSPLGAEGQRPRGRSLHLVVDRGYEVSVRTGKVVAKLTGAQGFSGDKTHGGSLLSEEPTTIPADL